MNKKGDFRETVETLGAVPRSILVLIIVVTIFLIVNIYISREVDTYKLENSIMLNRVFYSEDCLADNNGRVDIGLVDLNKFKQNLIESCVNKDIGVEIALIDLNRNRIREPIKIRDDILTKYLRLCGIEKHKDFNCDFREYYIRINNAEVQSGFLNVRIIRLK